MVIYLNHRHTAVGKYHNVMMTKLQSAIPLMHVIHQLYIYYCINWEWSVLNQTVEGGSLLTPMVPAHLSNPLNTGRGTGIETCGIGSVFPPDDPWTFKNCTLISDLLFKVWLMGCVTCVICIDWRRKGWPLCKGGPLSFYNSIPGQHIPTHGWVYSGIKSNVTGVTLCNDRFVTICDKYEFRVTDCLQSISWIIRLVPQLCDGKISIEFCHRRHRE